MVYLGYVPAAPGTFGTLAGIPIFLLLSLMPFGGYLGVLSLFLIMAVFISSRAEEVFGRADDGRIVIDEAAGYLVTMAGVSPGVITVVLGFLVFRAFDILKPWPVRFIDRSLSGGLGVVMDDAAAGLYSLAVLWVLFRIWPHLGSITW